MRSFDALNIVWNFNLVFINAHLVLLVVVSFLSKFFPGRFGIFSDNFGTLKFFPNALNFFLHLVILVLNISYHAYTAILKYTLFLELKPLLLERVHSFVHLQLREEVADKIIDDHRFFAGLRLQKALAWRTNTRLPQWCLLFADWLSLSSSLKCIKIVQIEIFIIFLIVDQIVEVLDLCVKLVKFFVFEFILRNLFFLNDIYLFLEISHLVGFNT